MEEQLELAAQRCAETGFRLRGREGLALIRLAERYRDRAGLSAVVGEVSHHLLHSVTVADFAPTPPAQVDVGEQFITAEGKVGARPMGAESERPHARCRIGTRA